MRTIASLVARRRILRTSTIVSSGIDPRRIPEALEKGTIVRSVMGGQELHGIFEHPEAALDPDRDACLAAFLTGGILSGQYAAQRHGLATCLPERMDVLVPHRVRLTERNWIRLVRTTRREALTVGIQQLENGLGIKARITDPARTVIDLLRARNVDGDSYRHGHEAMATYLDRGGKPSDLMEMAGKFEKWLPEALEFGFSSMRMQAEP